MENVRVPIGKRKPIKINVNQATHLQLINLPGISDITAAKIILYRKNNGDFKSLQEILTVVGRTEVWFDLIHHRLVV